ncbi:MAG: sodium-dependent transporter [Sedimentisphaeraceae bacterium JB056]
MSELKKKKIREFWPKEIFFILACVGAAVGVGNLWRFPYMAYENGGGTFLIPYLICMLLIALPIMLLEIIMGKKGNSIATAFQNINKRWTWIGWWALINSLVILFYYSVVLAWSIEYIFYSFSEAWGKDPASFFLDKVVKMSDGPFQLGGINLATVLALALVWGGVYLISRSKTKTLSKILLITVPLPAILLIVFIFENFTMPGSKNGVAYFLRPQSGKMFNISVWAAAASQVMLSMSLGMGQVIAYASRRKQDSALIKSGITICCFDVFFSLLAGITVFSTMGFLAHSAGVNISDLKLDGIFLAFVSYPMAISNLPFAPLWGIIFFVILVSLGIDSVFAAVEAIVAGCDDLSARTKSKSILAGIICLLGFGGSLIFTTGSGLYWLDIIDHWIAYYSIAAIVILECIIFGQFTLTKFTLNNTISLKKVYLLKIAKVIIVYFIPIILIFVFGSKFINEFSGWYSGYSPSSIIIGGWGVMLLSIIAGVIMSIRHNKK